MPQARAGQFPRRVGTGRGASCEVRFRHPPLQTRCAIFTAPGFPLVGPPGFSLGDREYRASRGYLDYTYCISWRNFFDCKQLWILQGVKSSHALRINSRCPWRHKEGARNVYNNALRRALSPLHPCESVTADVHGYPRGVTPIRHSLALRDNPVAHTEENDPITSPCHGMRCPPASPLFASWQWLLNTGCSLEALDITVH